MKWKSVSYNISPISPFWNGPPETFQTEKNVVDQG